MLHIAQEDENHEESKNIKYEHIKEHHEKRRMW